ncbi:MAG: hypothetical protein J7L25_00535 [Deltaproteobacteria bacterium]|nr:hypothetical protein [Candidatus Tharpella aukensis]
MQIAINDDLGRRLKKLPNHDKFVNRVLENALETRKTREISLKDAALELFDDYKNNKKLTEFTVLDGEDFNV